MKKDLVELIFILDRSGSMAGLEKDTIGGFNSMIKRQKETKGQALVTTVLFDDHYELIHQRKRISNVNDMTTNEYFVRGTTALLDAIGRSVTQIIACHKKLKNDEIPERTVVVITTDGMENASREYSSAKIKQMIEFQKEKYQWEFIFLGANMDALNTAKDFGISEDRVANYHADEEGTELNFRVIAETISELRVKKSISSDWKNEIDEDYQTRHKK
ncbi:vWA domain-containing protein [Paracholeplasma brassicae]|nr:VWA domain-containing protein [Paracholeplasma brassicae]